MKCEKCGGTLSMSAVSGGFTWWRCVACAHIQGTPAAGAAVSPPAGPRPSVPRAPGVVGERAPGRVGENAQGVAGQPVSTTATTTPPPPASAETPNGCGVCGSGDVQYVLQTDVGVDASTLEQGVHVFRSAFCSLDCLAERLGLVRAEAVAEQSEN